MTVPYLLPDDMARRQYLGDGADMGLVSTVDIVANVSVFPMDGIWASPEAVRDANRVFPSSFGEAHDISHATDTRISRL